ncbi:MAG TPA: hypothetical protein VF929_11850 [Gemmatimonadaceae bacterium]
MRSAPHSYAAFWPAAMVRQASRVIAPLGNGPTEVAAITVGGGGGGVTETLTMPLLDGA